MIELGRILFLSNDPAIVESQLSGGNVTLADAGALRDEASTDEITPLASPAYFGARLGRYPYTGVKLPKGVTAKDVVLHLLALPPIRAGLGVGKVFEFIPVAADRAACG